MAEGGVALGAWLSFHSPELVELSGYCGFDFVFLDGEHCGVAPRDCAELVRAADAAGIDAIVRVPRNEGPTLLGFLETGVSGLVIPHVRSADDARRAAEAMKYPPEGRRSVMFSSRAARYGVGYEPAEYLTLANRETMVIPLIEELDGMRNLEAIAATPAVDLVFLGEGDLAVDMGFAGQRDVPEVKAVVGDAIARARAARIPFGMSARTADAAADLVAAGASWIVTTTAALYAGAARELVDRVAASAAARPMAQERSRRGW
ncbi:MAG TPA: aldolase/citrate lyase family protein [Candidatus Limnocylindria bacterium]